MRWIFDNLTSVKYARFQLIKRIEMPKLILFIFFIFYFYEVQMLFTVFLSLFCVFFITFFSTSVTEVCDSSAMQH